MYQNLFETCKDVEQCKSKDCPNEVNFLCINCHDPIMVSSDRPICHYSLINDIIYRSCFKHECIEEVVDPNLWEYAAPSSPKDEE